MKFKVNEIFQSIHGEGLFVGMPMNFIRFTRCNLDCEWCDTGFREGVEMMIEEILSKMNRKWEWVELTGGEPMLEENLLDLIEELHKEEFKILLETNGTIFNREIFKRCDFISADIKPPSSGNSVFNGRVVQYCFKNPERSQLKIVIQDEGDLEFFMEIYNPIYNKWILQPEWNSMRRLNYKKILTELTEIDDEVDKNVRIIPQIHKILGVP